MPGRQAVELLVWYITATSRDQRWGRNWFTVFQGEGWQVMT